MSEERQRVFAHSYGKRPAPSLPQLPAFRPDSGSSARIETIRNNTARIDLRSEHTLEGDTMKKRLFVWPVLIARLLLPLVAACAGRLPQQSGNANQAAQAGGELYVLDSYTSAGQPPGARHIVALPVGMTNPAARLTLPAGLTDHKHQWLYVASSLGSARTSISALDTRSGATVRTFSLPGSYSTA